MSMTLGTDEVGAARSALSLKGAVFFVLCAAFPNGLYLRALEASNDYGFVGALYVTFNISSVIFVAMWIALQTTWESDLGGWRLLDYFAIIVSLLFVVVPVSPATWIGLTGLSLYFLVTRWDNVVFRRIFFLVLALTFSCLWGRLIFRFFMEYILNADAFLVATISGRPYFDNLIVTADNTVTLKVLEGCSSFTNLSLAFLGWVAARSYFGTTGVARSLIFVTISCASIVLINTVRIGLIALYPGQYELIHGNVGAAIVGVLVSISIAAISITGARR